MRKIVILMIVTLMGFQSQCQYLHWLYWVNEPSHSGTKEEFADITYGLSQGTISPNVVYRLKSGTTYKVPKPQLYLDYLVMVVRKIDPTTTSANLYQKIREAEETVWDNNFTGYYKNYFYSSVSGRVTFKSGYSGMSERVRILVLNGIPFLKEDCGNPLESEMPSLPSLETPPAPEMVRKEEIPAARYEPVQVRYEPYRIEEPKKAEEKAVVVKEEKKKGRWVKWLLIPAAIVTGVLIADNNKTAPHGSGSGGRDDSGNNGTGSGGRDD